MTKPHWWWTRKDTSYETVIILGAILGYVTFRPFIWFLQMGHPVKSTESAHILFAVMGVSIAIEFEYCHRLGIDRSSMRFGAYLEHFEFFWVIAAAGAFMFAGALMQWAVGQTGTVPIGSAEGWEIVSGIAGAAVIWHWRIWLSKRRLRYGRQPSLELRDASSGIVQGLDALNAFLFGSIVLFIGANLLGIVRYLLPMAEWVIGLFPPWVGYSAHIALIMLAIYALNYGLRRVLTAISMMFWCGRDEVEDQKAHGQARLATELEAHAGSQGVAESPIHALRF